MPQATPDGKERRCKIETKGCCSDISCGRCLRRIATTIVSEDEDIEVCQCLDPIPKCHVCTETNDQCYLPYVTEGPDAERYTRAVRKFKAIRYPTLEQKRKFHKAVVLLQSACDIQRAADKKSGDGVNSNVAFKEIFNMTFAPTPTPQSSAPSKNVAPFKGPLTKATLDLKGKSVAKDEMPLTAQFSAVPIPSSTPRVQPEIVEGMDVPSIIAEYLRVYDANAATSWRIQTEFIHTVRKLKECLQEQERLRSQEADFARTLAKEVTILSTEVHDVLKVEMNKMTTAFENIKIFKDDNGDALERIIAEKVKDGKLSVEELGERRLTVRQMMYADNVHEMTGEIQTTLERIQDAQEAMFVIQQCAYGTSGLPLLHPRDGIDAPTLQDLLKDLKLADEVVAARRSSLKRVNPELATKLQAYELPDILKRLQQAYSHQHKSNIKARIEVGNEILDDMFSIANDSGIRYRRGTNPYSASSKDKLYGGEGSGKVVETGSEESEEEVPRRDDGQPRGTPGGTPVGSARRQGGTSGGGHGEDVSGGAAEKSGADLDDDGGVGQGERDLGGRDAEGGGVSLLNDDDDAGMAQYTEGGDYEVGGGGATEPSSGTQAQDPLGGLSSLSASNFLSRIHGGSSSGPAQSRAASVTRQPTTKRDLPATPSDDGTRKTPAKRLRQGTRSHASRSGNQ